jgi:hypothetical protein
MNKMLSLLTSFSVVFVLTVGNFIPVQAAPQAEVMPSESINIAHFFKPPQGMDASTAISHFNTIILTNGDHTYRSQLEAREFASDIPQYFRADAIQNPGSCSATPLNNQAAYKIGDFCYISQNHPDWFLLDSNSRRITVTSGGDYYRMDPSNAGWRQFFLDRVMESQNQYGWTSLFLDNVEGGLSKFYGPRSVRFPDNASYQNAVAGFLQYLHINYSQRYGRSIVGNIVARADDAVWFTYLQYLDGAMQERFAVDWDETDYLSVSRWESDMTFMERTQSNGKYVILVAPGNRSDTNRQSFAFASYLLINQGKAAFRYSTDDSYREVWLYDNYRVDLGSPLGPRYRVGTSWRRDFSRGYVVVDPATHTARISNSVSSPPTTTTFADVPITHPYAEDIEILYANGLTGGCTTAPLKFCPDQIMDRAQSAVFMLRGSFGTSYAPPEELQHIFGDDWSRATWAEKWAEGMYNTGLSSGCTTSPLKFCPWDLTPREQAAVFGLKLKYGNSYEPPAATGTMFADMTDASYYATKWAEQAYRDGLIPSCGSSGGKPKFCPRELVTRGLGAYIIVRAKNLGMP